jgi:putative transposase
VVFPIANRSRRRRPGAERAFDGAKKIVGRKRHIAVDTDGRLLAANLTIGDLSDSAGLR